MLSAVMLVFCHGSQALNPASSRKDYAAQENPLSLGELQVPAPVPPMKLTQLINFSTWVPSHSGQVTGSLSPANTSFSKQCRH
jgi:hypothetical protein